jgi:Domain of unknown function (DUF4835)
LPVILSTPFWNIFLRSTAIASFLLLSLISAAQELNCKVTVSADQVQTSDRTIFKDLERAITQFMNSRKWTTDTYKNHERINCSLFIRIVKMPSIGNFQASAQVTSGRPIFNSNYESILLNFADREWEFEYFESMPLEFNDNNYLNNLTSLLAYYAYIIIGMDADSFSELGGNPYFQKALTVVNNAQPANRTGWAALAGNRNRYNLIENINNPQMLELRKNTYRYHRLALDTFEKNPEQSRTIILETLKNVKKVWSIYPTSIFVISFFDTKSTELVSVFSAASLQTKREAYDILVAIDSKRNIYQKIMGSN